MEQAQKRVSFEEPRSLSSAWKAKCHETLSRNEFRSHKVGNPRRIMVSDVERWLESRKDVLGGCS